MSDVLIIGGGQAGCMVAINLRKQKFKGNITIVTDEAYFPYQRPPLSKGFLVGTNKADNLFFKSENYYEKNNISVLTKKRAEKLDTKKQTVTFKDGGTMSYKKLVLTTGSKLNKITEKEDKKIIYLNSISQAMALKAKLEESNSIGIIGAGYIGLEVAASAKKMGLATTVFEAQERIMKRSASKEIATFLQGYHENMGVKFKLGIAAKKIEPTERAVNISLTNDAIDNPDFVVIGVGVQANNSIAIEAEIECENGILVDENCQTSNKNVYAAGDCSSYYFSRYGFRQRLESVQNAIDQAAIVSSSISGKKAGYTSVPWFWSDQYDLKLQIAGLSQGCDSKVVRGIQDDHRFSVCHFKDNRLRAVECVNDQKTFMQGKKLIEANSKITPEAMENNQTILKDWRPE
jgi:3-phenylpropionate/trans-cinnamate dioxygenase ferredoxin reductase subunit